jgi:hypothetical protein
MWDMAYVDDLRILANPVGQVPPYNGDQTSDCRLVFQCHDSLSSKASASIPSHDLACCQRTKKGREAEGFSGLAAYQSFVEWCQFGSIHYAFKAA